MGPLFPSCDPLGLRCGSPVQRAHTGPRAARRRAHETRAGSPAASSGDVGGRPSGHAAAMVTQICGGCQTGVRLLPRFDSRLAITGWRSYPERGKDCAQATAQTMNPTNRDDAITATLAAVRPMLVPMRANDSTLSVTPTASTPAMRPSIRKSRASLPDIHCVDAGGGHHIFATPGPAQGGVKSMVAQPSIHAMQLCTQTDSSVSSSVFRASAFSLDALEVLWGADA